MNEGNNSHVFRASKRGNPVVDNPFFAALDIEINNALVDDSRSIEKNIRSVYVCNRNSGCTPDTIDALVSRIPKDVLQALAEDLPEADLGSAYFELDLVNFLLRCTSNKVLSIVGSVGVGKSTFLAFVLHRLTSRCDSLSHLLPIILDGLFIGEDSPLHSEISHRLHMDCKSALKHLFPSEEADRINGELDRFYAENFPENGLIPSATSIVEYVAFLKGQTPDRTLVIVFDNLDQIDSKSVGKMSHLARAIYLRTGDPIILSMRPPTFAMHVETDANRGAFYTFRINLPPPDIHQVIRDRMTKVFSEGSSSVLIEDPRTGFTFRLTNSQEAVTNLCKQILNVQNQRVLLEGISNNNIRKSLASFQSFLRYPDLDFRDLFEVSIDSRNVQKIEPRRHDWNEHFLKGLMLTGRKYYFSSRSSPVFNVFFLDSNEYGLSYTILYRALSALVWSRGLISKRYVVEWLESFGFNRGHTDRALNTLLRCRLAVSPDHENDIRLVSHLSISESGRFYYDELLSKQTYLYEAILDIPLSHKDWHESTREDYHARTSSILEYLSRVITSEKHEIELLTGSRNFAKPVSVLMHCGLLSTRISTMARKVADIGSRAKRRNVLNIANDFRHELDELDGKIQDINTDLMSFVSQSQEENQQDSGSLKKISWDLGENGEFSFSYPERVSPMSSNLLKANLSLNFEDEPDVLMAHLLPDEVDSHPFEVMWPLHKNGSSRTYSGEVIMHDIEVSSALPPGDLTIFADSRPILSRKIGK